MSVRILVVDDEPEILEFLNLVLEDEGYTVQQATGGRRALEGFGPGQYDLMITDLRMPEMDGHELMRAVKEIDPEIEIIVLTGFATIENAVESLRNEGAYDFLIKPLDDIEQLVIAVERALEKRRLVAERETLLEQMKAANQELALEVEKRKQTEKDLHSSKEHYKLLFHNVPIMIHSINSDGYLTEVNNWWLEKMGYARAQVIGRRSTDFMTPQTATLVDNIIRPSFFETGAVDKVPMQFVAKEGEVIETLCSARAKYGENGEIQHSMAVFEDITERLRAEKAREALVAELKTALAEVKALQGIIPICASCKKIRDDFGFWQQVEKYLGDRTDARFSHGICPECTKRLYPGFDKALEQGEK